MKSLLSASSMFLASTLLGACGGQNPETYEPDAWHPLEVPTTPAPAPSNPSTGTGASSSLDPHANLKKALKEFSDASYVKQEIGTHFQESAALLIMASKSESVSQCSGSLIAPNLLLTNSHCIPEHLTQPGADCSGWIHIIFPSKSNSRSDDEHVACKQVLKNSGFAEDRSMLTNDYAVLELERKVDRKILEISFDGFQNEEVVKIFKLSPPGEFERPSRSTFGKLEVEECHVTHKPLIMQDAKAPLSRLVYLSQCSIEHGNSGSMIVGSNGKIKGVVHIGVQADKIMSMLREQFASILGELIEWTTSSGDLSQHAVGSNLACLDLPDPIGIHDSVDCGPKIFPVAQVEPILSLIDEKMKESHSAIQPVLDSMNDSATQLSANSKNFQFEVKGAFAQPKCFRSENWKKQTHMREDVVVLSGSSTKFTVAEDFTLRLPKLSSSLIGLRIEENRGSSTTAPQTLSLSISGFDAKFEKPSLSLERIEIPRCSI